MLLRLVCKAIGAGDRTLTGDSLLGRQGVSSGEKRPATMPHPRGVTGRKYGLGEDDAVFEGRDEEWTRGIAMSSPLSAGWLATLNKSPESHS